MKNDLYIKSLLKDDSLNLSVEDLEKMIAQEESKPVDEMDVELIEYCLDELLKLSNTVKKNPRKKPQRSSQRKILIIAAAIIVVLSLVFSVSALAFDFNIINEIIELYDTHIRVRFDKSDASANNYKLLGTDLAKELATYGIAPVLLPELVLTADYNIGEIQYIEDEYVKNAHIEYMHNQKKGYIQIDQYSMKEQLPALDIQKDAELIEQFRISSIDVFLFQQGKNFLITYQDGLQQYLILIEGDYESAILLADSIK